jgi:tetratricopeptide (TPR) repeat protein
LAQIARGAGDLQHAKLLLDREIKMNPKNDGAWTEKGDLALFANKLEEALVHFRKAAALNPRNAAAFLGSGSALVALHRDLGAVEELRKALEISPGHVQALWLLGLTYRKLALREDALAAFLELRSKMPDEDTDLAVQADKMILELKGGK